MGWQEPIRRACGNGGETLPYPTEHIGSPHFAGVRWNAEQKTSVPLWRCEPNLVLVDQMERVIVHNARMERRD